MQKKEAKKMKSWSKKLRTMQQIELAYWALENYSRVPSDSLDDMIFRITDSAEYHCMLIGKAITWRRHEEEELPL